MAAVPGNASWSLAAVSGTAKTQLGVTLNAHFYGKVHFKACKKVSFSVRVCEVLAQHVCAFSTRPPPPPPPSLALSRAL